MTSSEIDDSSRLRIRVRVTTQKRMKRKKDENWLKWVTLTRAASERTVGDGSTYAVYFRRIFEIFDEILALTVKNALRRGHHNISKQQNVTKI